MTPAPDDDPPAKIVRTPGGLAPAGKVRHVKPGQRVVRRDGGVEDIEDLPASSAEFLQREAEPDA